jgi:HAD superfamily hydrolase (TIGR01509 family)
MSTHGQFAAAVLDVDGVLVASPHERAWREALVDLLSSPRVAPERTVPPDAFTTAVYQEHVAGKARLAGARAVLEYFHLPDADTLAEEYARRKQQRLEELIAAGEFTAFDDALRFVTALHARGIRLAAASSSKNANAIMERIRLDGASLLDVFTANVSGRDVPHGKPHPDLFLLAAAELRVPPASCIVVEDAPSGVAAAKAGGMAAMGVARLGDEKLLRATGADLVVTTLDDVDVDALVAGRLARTAAHHDEGEGARLAAAMQPTADDRWLLLQTAYSPLIEPAIESRFAISNGFLGVRGSRSASRGPMWMSFLHTPQLGILAAHVRRGSVRHAEHRAAGSRARARPRLAPHPRHARRAAAPSPLG